MNKQIIARKRISVLLAFLLAISVMIPANLPTVTAAGTDLGISFSATTTSLAPGEETEITVFLQNYANVADLMGLQVDVLLDTTLVDYVPLSAATLSSGNSGDIIGTNYNSGNKKVIFQYASLNENQLPFNRSNSALFKFKVKAKDTIVIAQTAIFSVTQLAVSDASGNRTVAVSNTLAVSIIPASTVELGIQMSATTTNINPGSETEITVALKNYDNISIPDIMGMQVDVLLDTTLVEYVASSVSTLASGNSGDIIGSSYNSTSKKMIFQFASLNEGELPFGRSNVNLFKFKVKAKDTITLAQTAVFTVTQFAISDISGNRQVAVSDTLSINIVPETPQPATLTSIAITTQPTKTSYIEGQAFDKTGMVITAYYSDSSSSTVANYTVDKTILTISDTNVIVSYTENSITKTVTQPVTVVAKTLSSIAITTIPTKTTFTAGEAFSSAGGKITAYYNNGTSEQFNITNAMCSGYIMGNAGIQTVTVTYSGKTATYSITVNPQVPVASGFLTVGSVTGSKGDTVSVPVTISQNPGIIALYLSLNYDTARLKLTGVTNGTVFNSAALVTGNDLNATPFAINFSDDLASSDINGNGTLATLQFEILSTAPLGEATVSVSYEPNESYNFDFDLISFEITNGKVDVVNTYTVTFKDWDGTVLKTQTVIHGEAATAPTEPSRTGYNFTGWNAAFNNITTDLIVTAQYQVKTYTITFKDWDGTVLKTQTISHGEAATAPTEPSRTGYNFTGWSATFNNITADLIVTAQYQIKTYTVTFKDWDGTVLKTQTISHGEAATAPTEPSRTGYNFTGWNAAFNNITADLIIVAQYQIKTYTVTFKGYNNITLEAITVEHGNNVTPPAAPTVDGYVFTGWNDRAFTGITESKTITALYVIYADAPKIVVSSPTGYRGKTVDVTVSLENNPGIITMCLNLDYDTSKLHLIQVINGTILVDPAHGNDLNISPFALNWDGGLLPSNITANGVIVTLRFEVLTEAEVGDSDITITFDPANVYDINMDQTFFLPVNGKVNIQVRLPGDVNDDGLVNAQDVTILRRKLANWSGVTINEANSDVNGDGLVNAQDVTILRRYLAKWVGVVLV